MPFYSSGQLIQAFSFQVELDWQNVYGRTVVGSGQIVDQ